MEDLGLKLEFWKDKKILLTGHTGFKGSWLSLWLQKLGSDVIGFSKSIPTNPSLFEIAKVKEGMISIMGDVRDFTKILEVINRYQPEIIIHMAAQSLVRESYEDPIETFETNVIGTANILEAARKSGMPRVIINVTSDKCYQNTGSQSGYREEDPMGGYDPYSSSKGCAELVTASFRNSFFNPKNLREHGTALASVRAGNVIGGGDWAKDRLVPDIMRDISENKSIKIRNPKAVRPWQFVLEPLNGYLLLAEKLWDHKTDFFEGWNFGPNDDGIKSVSWIVEKFIQLWGDSLRWEHITSENLHEENFLKLNWDKAHAKLKWAPKMNLDLAIKWTVDWYKKFKQNNDMRLFTEKQIEEFSLM